MLLGERGISMSKKENIKRLWLECFGDSPEYADMYFTQVYRDDNALEMTDEEGRTVSSLQLADYEMLIEGRHARLCYLCGATTARRARGRGYMSRLMLRALDTARERGAMMAALIPAHDWLYFFFERFGFSDVYLADRQCFTSFHPFPTQQKYFPIDDPYAPEVYDSFRRYEEMRPGGILHTKRDFLNVIDDLKFRRGGTFVAVGREDTPVAGMAWAFDCERFVQVNELLGIDEDARTGAMRELRKRFPDRQFTVLAPARDNTGRRLHSRGMGRLVNVEMCLSLIADANPDYKAVIRVYDPLLEDNSHTYELEDGKCRINDDCRRKPDLDVTVDVLTRIVFSSPATGDIVGFPSERTHISLMLH